jgi:hypothetical protein
MAAVVMVWPLIECPQSSKRAITGFKIIFFFLLMWTNSKPHFALT